MSQSTAITNPESVLANRIYSRLRRLAQSMISRERSCTLTATGLVHELYLKLGQQSSGGPQSYDDLPPYAARIMKQLLISRARRRLARQNSETIAQPQTESQVARARYEYRVRLVELDDAISRLSQSLPENAELVRLHLYGELSIEEAGAALGMSRATAYRKWNFSKAWLSCQLNSAES